MELWTGNRQSGGRQAHQAKLSEQPAAPVYITRKIAYYDFLDEDALAGIEAEAFIAQRKEAMLDAWYLAKLEKMSVREEKR